MTIPLQAPALNPKLLNRHQQKGHSTWATRPHLGLASHLVSPLYGKDDEASAKMSLRQTTTSLVRMTPKRHQARHRDPPSCRHPLSNSPSLHTLSTIHLVPALSRPDLLHQPSQRRPSDPPAQSSPGLSKNSRSQSSMSNAPTTRVLSSPP